jgi:hypothetical protein
MSTVRALIADGRVPSDVYYNRCVRASFWAIFYVVHFSMHDGVANQRFNFRRFLLATDKRAAPELSTTLSR